MAPNPIVGLVEQMVQAMRRERLRRDARKAELRARWRSASAADRFGARAEDIPTLDRVPTRAWFEANPMNARYQADAADAMDRANLALLTRIDPYVADLRDGTFDVDPGALTAVGSDAAWVKRAGVQRGLAAIRDQQQRVVTHLAAEAGRRPLDFARHGTRFWPSDLMPEHLARLERWSRDDVFQTDIAPIERAIRAAYDHEDTKRRARDVPRPVAVDPARAKLMQPIPDGFGGLRDTPPPVFRFEETGPRILAFDKATGRPGTSLLMLLRHCGEHPRSIVFAADGRLMGVENTPKLIDPLIRMWRHDDHVQALIVETVSASRTAGRAVWPQQHAAAIRALAPSSEPDRSLRADRDPGVTR